MTIVEPDADVETVPDDWCDDVYPEHDWTPGDLECRRCGADLSTWNED